MIDQETLASRLSFILYFASTGDTKQPVTPLLVELEKQGCREGIQTIQHRVAVQTEPCAKVGTGDQVNGTGQRFQ